VKTLIVYGTRYGATAGTAEEIARIFHEKGLEIKVANLTEKIQGISEYDLVIVGSSMSMGNWASEAEEFLKKFNKDFETKKLALFISSLKPVEERKGKTERVARTRKIGLDDKISKYNLKPIAIGFFGGVIDYNKMNFITRKAVEAGYKSDLQKYGFKETTPGTYDLRDWDEIRSWGKELARKAQ
jgi:menaquinone-dependent protoporphyrinogen oxidase